MHFRLFLIIGAALVALLLYPAIHRMLRTWGLPMHKKRYKALALLVAILMGAAAPRVSSISALFVLHFAAFSGVLALVQLFVQLILCKQYQNGLKRLKWLLGSGLLPLVLTACMLLFGYVNMHTVVPTFYTVETQKPIRSEGYRVALIADVHFGVSLDETALRRVCDEISGQQPDVVILCGDIIDSSTTKEGMQQVFAALGSIKSTCGSYYIYGNHDRPGEWGVPAFTRADLAAAIESNGITILQDKVISLTDDFLLAGREDRGYSNRSGRKPVQTLLADADPDDLILLLDHQPNEYALCGKAGADLILSGHTHGGQLWPIGQVQKLLHINDHVYGHTFVDSDTQAIVTSGLAGWAYPIKTAAPAEYVIIDIKPAN